MAAWANRLGREKKVEHEDWSKLSDEMILRCESDVRIQKSFFVRLVDVLVRLGFTEKSLEIQHKIWHILGKQQQNGFYFNQAGATHLLSTLRQKEEELASAIRIAFPPTSKLVRDREVFTKTGTEAAIYVRDCERYQIERYDDGTRYRATESCEFNLGSPKQRVEKLVELGWNPRERTPSGSPKPFEKGKLAPSLEEFLEDRDVPEVRLIADWMVYNGRGNMVGTWLDYVNPETSCIHGQMWPADTLRFRHEKPNTANIPAVKVDKDTGEVIYGEAGFYHYEARDCWTARPDRVLVGTDASGLELRMLANELKRDEFTKQVVEGSPHDYNAKLVGVDKPKAKTLLYSIQYGAQARKVASILGVDQKEGARIRQLFLDRLGLTEVMNEYQDYQQRGRIPLVDGSQVICPSPHAALNYRLQGSGARVMQQATLILEEYVRRDGLDSLKVGDIHDEFQYDVAPADATRHSERAVQSIREAGLELNLSVPLTGESKVGKTWAETH